MKELDLDQFIIDGIISILVIVFLHTFEGISLEAAIGLSILVEIIFNKNVEKKDEIKS